jgi:hypothetical protein
VWFLARLRGGCKAQVRSGQARPKCGRGVGAEERHVKIGGSLPVDQAQQHHHHHRNGMMADIHGRLLEDVYAFLEVPNPVDQCLFCITSPRENLAESGMSFYLRSSSGPLHRIAYHIRCLLPLQRLAEARRRTQKKIRPSLLAVPQPSLP